MEWILKAGLLQNYCEKFAKLTRQEEKHGLLEDSRAIGTRNGWQIRLDERGFQVRGHRLFRNKS